jgi:tRNA-splicing ligase RtcB
VSLSKLAGSQTEVLLWSPLQEVEEEARQQLIRTASLPSAYKVLAMPDVHAGKGVTVGAVVALVDAVCPNVVGVDIGCGMQAFRTNLTVDDLPKDLHALRMRVESLIPSGTGQAHEKPLELVATAKYSELWERFAQAEQSKCSLERAQQQMGSLGSGNHFIEVCVDTNNRIWLMLHSGSRFFGLQVAESHAWKAEVLPMNQALPDKTLSVLPRGTPDFDAYWRDMQTAQIYAKLNRDTMFSLLLQALDMEGFKIQTTDMRVDCHHNYATEEEHDGKKLIVARKGAISARKGEMGIIPGAMGRKSFIVEGLGSPESLQSASHGAGRKMSRTKALKTFSLEDLKISTKGVECHLGKGVLDEIGEAYKDISKVMDQQADLVRPLFELRSLLTVKGHEDTMQRDRKAKAKDRDESRREARRDKGHRWRL